MYGNQVCKESGHSFSAAIAAFMQHCLRSALAKVTTKSNAFPRYLY
ncbi:hypothetical protein [Vibrio aestuarianus]|nr:hypothetical protein [Vibrio aestuarianus]MDE1236312.1 hypothetical protein [Vibrio aestuarianus]MDE1247190.1 hypothetical protein [Vibrio aestuarianus]NGZ65025.1 hypothetical protein [Vibrio aestuarianus subsp. cardii]NGZ68347.1 hypothetical protein [Vibrio aestuarianus subsp. cardii]